MKKIISVIFLLVSFTGIHAQYNSRLTAQQWVDSVFNSLSENEKIAQLMVIRAHSNLGPDHVQKVVNDIRTYNVGGLCFFQGGPVRQANLTNYYQSIAKTPIMVTIDGEWGVGMRLDSVTKFPYQLTLGALSDPNLVYRMGIAVGQQCKRLGIHVNYAPVVDINNNPNNPVIGYRSFGEDKIKVSSFGVAYMKGMQDAGIMACAKHFPGHGDVDVDSHFDLPVISKSRQQLDSMELTPFRAIFKAGVGSVMIAHLYIPSIDSTANTATSISRNSVTDLLRKDLGYQGLTFTDALEMKGVAKYFPDGTIAVEALVAGNDMLCLPASVPETIEAVKKAINEKRLNWDELNVKVKKVLAAKYQLGLNQAKKIETIGLVADLNANTDIIREEVARKSLTALSKSDQVPLPLKKKSRIAYVAMGINDPNQITASLKNDYEADIFFINYKDAVSKMDSVERLIRQGNYNITIMGFHNYSLRPTDNFNISNASLDLYKKLNNEKTLILLFGNVLAAKNFCDAKNLVSCYQDDNITQMATVHFLEGNIKTTGKLPVSVCNFKFGDGLAIGGKLNRFIQMRDKLNQVDSIVYDAIAQKAFPGCVVFAAYKGDIIYHKAFGHFEYDEKSNPVSIESIFDLASVTKISATTVSVMKLYEQGKLDLNKTLGDYLPWVKGTDKAGLIIKDILLHQAGLVPFIPFYKETIDSVTGIPKPGIYSDRSKPGFTIRVAENIYLRNDWEDTLIDRILKSPLGKRGNYVYSDNDFIFLGKIVEQLTGMSLDQYAEKMFYRPMGMQTTGFKPRNRFPVDKIVPTELEKHFRMQLTRGDVHDEGASLFGGVAGHAGLFSTAEDLAMLYQMLYNEGEFNGVHYLKPETIRYFTSYQNEHSRRGLGFDKTERDKNKEPYPSELSSTKAFGHTGFTGTCVWVDPQFDLVYIFLSNRVFPTRNNPRLSSLGVRGKIQDTIYKAVTL